MAMSFRLRPAASKARFAAAWAAPSVQNAGFASAASGKKLVVFGGNGFIGQEVCKTALNAGFEVVGVSRRIPVNEDWTNKVEWINADVFDHQIWAPQLQEKQIDAAVSTVGGIRDNQRNSTYYNGDANQTILQAAPKFQTFVYLGTQKYGFPVDEVLRGYYLGKHNAEQALFEAYPESGASFHLPFVYGEGRHWPVDPSLQFLKNLSEAVVPKFSHDWVPSLRPPMSKEEVARAIVRAVQINLGQIEHAPVSKTVGYEKIQELAKL